MMNNELIKRFTNEHRTFKAAPDNRFIIVYYDGRHKGFIWNCDKVIRIDGEEVICSGFFR